MQLISKYPPASRGKIVVWGLLASYPFGGMTWQVLHHLVGFRRLGFDVWYVEDSDRLALDPVRLWPTNDTSANVAYLTRFMKAVGLADRWIFRLPGDAGTCAGAGDIDGLKDLYRTADAVFNVCGAQELRPMHKEIGCLVYLETDPVVNQVAVASNDTNTIAELDSYHYLFTYGENIGNDDCPVPVERYAWHPTRPPVVTDWWAGAKKTADAPFTTIANWKHSGKDVVWKGETWRWSKHYEFMRFLNLPARTGMPMELALGAIEDKDRIMLEELGWRTIESSSLSDPAKYRDYISNSLGEFTATKEQYVRPKTGWFSDRSSCYLAAGKPVITQDTGFGKFISTGEGLFAFSSEDEAAASIAAVAGDYGRHSRAAHEIAREYFEAERVLGDICRKIGLL